MEMNPVLFFFWLKKKTVSLPGQDSKSTKCFKLSFGADITLFQSIPLQKEKKINKVSWTDTPEWNRFKVLVCLTKLIMASGQSNVYESAVPQRQCENTTDSSEAHLPGHRRLTSLNKSMQLSLCASNGSSASLIDWAYCSRTNCREEGDKEGNQLLHCHSL